MSKRKTPKTSTPAPKANGLKLARELMGLILLFFGMYLLLSLMTFDARDPGFNHAISTAKGVHNSAGVIGSYLAGMLTDIFGVAAYIWPTFVVMLALRQLFFRFSVQWWRYIGFVCLLLCFMMAGSAWKFQLGDIIGGGLIGDAIYGITWKFLSETGSFLLGLCFFLISLQLIFTISWLALLSTLWLRIVSCWNDMRARSHSSDGDEPDDDPTPLDEKPKKQESKVKVADKKQSIVNIPDKNTSACLDEASCVESSTDTESFHVENAEKTNLWLRIKNFFIQTTPSQSQSQDVAQAPAPEYSPEHSELIIDEVDERSAPVPIHENIPTPVTYTQNPVCTQQGSGANQDQEAIHFLQENDDASLNPFAIPWARACDIQAEWAQPVEPNPVDSNCACNTTQTANSETKTTEQSTLFLATNNAHTAQVGLNGGLIVGRDTIDLDASQTIYNDAQEEFLFDTLPEDMQKDCVQDPSMVENQQENTTDFEIDLDPSMAIQGNLLPSIDTPIIDTKREDVNYPHGEEDNNTFIFDSDGSMEDGEQSRSDSIAATLRDLQTILDVSPTVSAQDDASLVTETVADLASTITSSPQKDSSIPNSTDNIEPNNTESPITAVDFEESSLIADDASPSFEVLMDAANDGITDLTEEEVGTGGAAKAAPVKMKTRLPHLDLLQDVTDDEQSKPRLDILTEKGERLTKCLADFAIQGELTRITPGPVVTMFEFRPAPGVKVSRIANLSDDLALALKAIAVRIQAPIPGTDTVGIEIPNEMRETIYFKDLLASETFHDASSLLTLAVGKDSAGRPSVADLAKMPHLLVAGATGAGKSVCLNSILLSFLYKARPEDVQLLLIDPKRIELAVYADLPHLVHPVVTDMSHAKNALEWAVHEMDNRYEGMARLGVRNIAGYNQKLESFGNDKPIEYLDLEFMPYLVIIIDELADLMLTAAKEVETSIVRLAQLARAAGIHMVLATQRPSVDVVTGLIKANFPCRISFQVTSKHDSRTILDTVGAEHLLGRGDMLFKPSGGRLQRLHGAFVSDDEVANVVEFWKRQQSPMYRVDFAQWGSDATQENLDGGAGALADDPIYNDAVEFVLGQGQASISLIQRRFRIGFNKAARYVEQMELDGFVGPANGSKPRPVIKGHDIQ